MKSVIALASAVALTVLAQEIPVIPYPSEYRSWSMVKSYVITQESKLFAERGGFHHYFANEKAMEGYRTGKFPEGSVIVDEGVRAKDADGVTIEAGLRSVEVMRKGTAYEATGGWGFERFEGDSTSGAASAKTKSACFACHATAKTGTFVFSNSRLAGVTKQE